MRVYFDPQLRAAILTARSRRDSLPNARLRVTPAIHQELAKDVLEGTDMLPEAVVVESVGGIRVEIDADIPDPGWDLNTW